MENTQASQRQAKANLFWETHFSEYIDDTIDEHYAMQIDFWTQLNTAFVSEDIATIEAVMLSEINLRITKAKMHLRIVSIAKQIWDDKHREN